MSAIETMVRGLWRFSELLGRAFELWVRDPVGVLRQLRADLRGLDAADWAYGLAAGLAVLSVGLLTAALS